MIEVKEILAKAILTPSKLPDTDYVINPYIGCRFGCIYCYASFMGRFVDKKVDEWGTYVYVKINTPELLEQEVWKLKQQGKGKSILLSSVTDPYQGMEAKYQLTRKCLEVLARYGFQGALGILTKSDLVLRDINVLGKLRKVEIGFTITSTRDGISRYFEKFAPPVSARLSALKKFNELGFSTYAFVGPLLPHFVAQEHELDQLFRSIADTGIKAVYVEHINLSPYIRERLWKEMKGVDFEIAKRFYESQNESYRLTLSGIVEKLVKRHHLYLRLGSAIFHHE